MYIYILDLYFYFNSTGVKILHTCGTGMEDLFVVPAQTHPNLPRLSLSQEQRPPRLSWALRQAAEPVTLPHAPACLPQNTRCPNSTAPNACCPAPACLYSPRVKLMVYAAGVYEQRRRGGLLYYWLLYYWFSEYCQPVGSHCLRSITWKA